MYKFKGSLVNTFSVSTVGWLLKLNDYTVKSKSSLTHSLLSLFSLVRIYNTFFNSITITTTKTNKQEKNLLYIWSLYYVKFSSLSNSP